jgi:hypothetical protein
MAEAKVLVAGRVARAGPAHLDTGHGVAHKLPTCPALDDAISTATACEGEMFGFVWCKLCGDQEFIVDAEGGPVSVASE